MPHAGTTPALRSAALAALLAAVLAGVTAGALVAAPGRSPARPDESRFYRIVTIPVPDGLRLEVSGMALLPDARLAVAIRKGEVWLVEGAHDDPPDAVRFHRFAGGLHEPLGLAWHDGHLWLAQRAEVTRLADRDGDGIADEYRTVATGWGVSGNYHEYAYGPVVDRDGVMWVTLNCRIGKGVTGSDAWRGWSLRIDPDGSWRPVSGGMRSPCGLGVDTSGNVLFTEQQGNWTPTCSLRRIEEGAFHGHVDSLRHCARPGATFARPESIPSGLSFPEAVRRIGPLRPPAVWFPYRKMGQGSTDVLCDTTGGRFGPFAGQLFVGDFTLSLISRVFLEEVDGELQGACFPFRRGFDCAVLRMAWGEDGSMFVGETNRGWNSLGTRSFGLQRVIWTGATPFEVETMRARPDGFELSFTRAVDRDSALRAASYAMTSYTYRYHETYGSPEIDAARLEVRPSSVSGDGRAVRLLVEPLRPGYVHELHLDGVASASGDRLLHPRAYYTLNRVPSVER